MRAGRTGVVVVDVNDSRSAARQRLNDSFVSRELRATAFALVSRKLSGNRRREALAYVAWSKRTRPEIQGLITHLTPLADRVKP